MSKKYFQIAALCVVVAVVLSAFAPAASATTINYNRDYWDHTSPFTGMYPDTYIEDMEPVTAAFTNAWDGDAYVPSNSANDLANGITPVIVNESGTPGGSVANLTDGVMSGNGATPWDNDLAYTPSGTSEDLDYWCCDVYIDLGAIHAVKEVNTYSWHNFRNEGQRAHQVYALYASDGTAAGFDVTDETSNGWELIAEVDSGGHFSLTDPDGGRHDDGWGDGQIGVSVQLDAGSDYRYFYFVVYSGMSPSCMTDGTMYREWDIVAVPEPSTFALLAAGLIGLLAYAWRKRK